MAKNKHNPEFDGQSKYEDLSKISDFSYAELVNMYGKDIAGQMFYELKTGKINDSDLDFGTFVYNNSVNLS